ncbi:ParB/RepB/Spo0J family partition protein [Streptomyces sp. NRRL F-5135]|uniref:ParB/RepB/Spo0J family partition protein n=1 Tax=Streptomyces sp. NRRL F-5135 TaxID=1463858 RepID=UPI000690D40E|nr:ParB N-terminal domain-containing protein [Streptomyces sp. NRRL F-5135]
MARDEFDDFFGDEDSTSYTDTRADGRLYRVPITRLVPNLVNPRQDFGTTDELIDFGKSLQRRQNQPCPVVSRIAYLKLWPDHAEQIGSVDYVLVSGERRFRAATEVGLAALDCVVNDGFATDRKTFMEAVVSENVDRQNFDAIEEAYAVQALVREFGTNRAVAQHFERADGWVTQRVLLTHLAPQMQEQVRKKSVPLEAARKLGMLARDNKWDAAEQAKWWEQEQSRRNALAEAKAAKKRAEKTEAQRAVPSAAAPPRVSAPEERDGSSVAEQRPTVQAEPRDAPSFTAVKPHGSSEAVVAPRSVPEQHARTAEAADAPEATEQGTPHPSWAEGVQWDRPDELSAVMIERMELQHRRRVVKLLLEAMPYQP